MKRKPLVPRQQQLCFSQSQLTAQVPQWSKSQDSAIEAKHSYGNRGPVVSDNESSQSTEGDVSESPWTHETGSLPVSQLLTQLETHNKQSLGHQTVISLLQLESSNERLSIVAKDSKQHHDGVVEMKCSCMNVILGVDDDKISCLSKEMVNERQTAHCMPSLTNERGGAPATQQPTHSTTYKEYPSSPQTTADSLQRETARDLHIQHMEGPCGSSHIQQGEEPCRGSRVQCDSGANNERCSKSNVKHKKKLTKLSVRLQEWSTTLYSPARRPKVLDKHVQHVDDRYNAEAHNAPWTMERDCGEQFLNQQDTSGRQRSLCDSCHASALQKGEEWSTHTPHTPHTKSMVRIGTRTVLIHHHQSWRW
jgi:hypothetical protein